MQRREELDVRQRTSTQTSWKALLQRAVEFVVQGPTLGFRFDLLDQTWHA